MTGEHKQERAGSGGVDSAVVLTSQIFITLVTLGTQSLLAWSLAPQGRGAYAVCLVFAMVLGVFFVLGCDRAAQHFTMSGKLSLSQGVSAALTLAGAGSLVGMVAGWFMADFPWPFFANASVEHFRLSLPLVPLILFFVVFQLQFAGARRFVRLGVISLIQVFTNLTLLALMAFLSKEGASVGDALLAYEASLVLAIFLFIGDLRRHCALRLALPSVAHMRLVLGYGLRYFGARFGTLLDNQVGVLFLSVLATRDEIGLFAAVATLTLRVCIIGQSIEAATLPRLSANPSGEHLLLGRAIRVSSLLTGLVLVGLIGVATPLIPLLFSPAFAPAVPIIWILAPGILFQGAALMFMAYFRASDRPEINSRVIWLALAVNMGVVAALYPLVGFTAAAWAMSAGYAVRLIVLGVLYARENKSSSDALWRFNSGDFLAMRTTAIKILGRINPKRPGGST